MDDRDLMAIYADTIFTYDAQRRMLRSNEPRVQVRRPAPFVFLGRTRTGSIVRFGASAPDALVHEIEELVDHLPPVRDLPESPATFTAIREALERYVTITTEEGGPAYRYPDSISSQGEAILLTDVNIEAARYTYPSLLEDFRDWSPCFTALHDGRAVSLCMSSRVTAVAEAAGVDTLPAFRGRGYAAAATAAW